MNNRVHANVLFTAQVGTSSTQHNGTHSNHDAKDDFYTGVFWVVLFLAVLLKLTFSTLKSYRMIKGTPQSKVRSAAQGFVELQGHQQPSLLGLKSPLTLSECTWYEYTIEKKVTHNSKTTWETIYQEQSDCPIVLDDETGHCLIFPEQAEVVTNQTFIKYWRNGEPWNEGVSANQPQTKTMRWLLGIADLVTLGGVSLSTFSQPYRHTEKIMCPNDFVYALGFFQTYYTVDAITPLLKIKDKEQTLHLKHTFEALLQKDPPIHTLSYPTEEANPVFVLSNNPEAQVMRKELMNFYIFLSLDLVLIAALILMVLSHTGTINI